MPSLDEIRSSTDADIKKKAVEVAVEIIKASISAQWAKNEQYKLDSDCKSAIKNLGPLADAVEAVLKSK